LLKSWPCKRSWESTAIDCLASKKCRSLSTEVFDCDDVDDVLSRGDTFFQLMPKPTE
jgi:hypothetical protein